MKVPGLDSASNDADLVMQAAAARLRCQPFLCKRTSTPNGFTITATLHLAYDDSRIAPLLLPR